MKTGWPFNRNSLGSIVGALLMISASRYQQPEFIILGAWLTAVFCVDQICLTITSAASAQVDHADKIARRQPRSAA